MSDTAACALGAIGILCITAIEITALKLGKNGKLLAGVVAAIGVIVGYAFGKGI